MSVSDSDFEVRQLASTDAEAFSALRREVTADNPIAMGLTMDEELSRSIEGFRTQLSFPEPNAAFGAFLKDRLVGTAAVAWPSTFLSSRHKADLWGVFVSPLFRRCGIGRALVGKAVAHAQAQGARRVNLTVYVPNASAINLYESLGFLHCGTEPEAICIESAYYDGLRMSLRLAE
jgi:ribosomal protein S18 acetylase RimI-like enzyme